MAAPQRHRQHAARVAPARGGGQPGQPPTGHPRRRGTGRPGTQAAPPVPGATGVTPPADLGYHGPVFMDSDIYKTLEAIGWELGGQHRESPGTQGPRRAQDRLRARRSAAAFGAFAATTIELLARVQRPDGYLNSYVQASGEPRYQNLASSHEMYCDGHFFQAAIALARGAGDQDAMDIAIRLADHLVKEFAGQARGLDGHPIVETALVELYRETGTTAYRDLAAQFVEQRGRGLAGDSGFGRRYLQDHLPVRERTTEVGHAVRALYLEAGVTDVATETNDTELLNGSITRWADMVATKTVADRRQRLAPRGRVVRRPLRAAARPRLQRDVRLDRQLPVELAAAARHRRGQVRRPHGADPLQRLRRRDQHRRDEVLLRQPAAAPRRPLREGRPGPPPRMVQVRLLPPEHHAHCSRPSTTTWPRATTTPSPSTSTPPPRSPARA